MKKISTLYKKDPNDLGRVVDEVNPNNEWALTNGVPTRKYDGTACAIIGGELYKRYDCKINIKTGEYKKPIPKGAIPCQEADLKSGHHPHWVRCDKNNPADKWHFDAFKKNLPDGTYELIGEKVQGNPEKIKGHHLVKHGSDILNITNLSFEALKKYLSEADIEGIVFHEKGGERMCKIRKSDFGLHR